MKLEHISQIISLASTGSFSKSAQQLFMSQPNLSLSVKQLEAEIGHSIFERTSKGLVLTPFGREFVNHLYSLNSEMESLNDFCFNSHARYRLEFHVAAVNCNWLNDFFSQTICMYEGAEINFSLYNSEVLASALELLQASLCELAIVAILSPYCKKTYEKFRSSNMIYNKLTTSPLHVMVGEKNPLYHSPENITLEAIKNFPFVTYGNPRGICSSFFSNYLGISVHSGSNILVNTNGALYNIVANTQAVTISGNTMHCPFHPGVKAFPIPGLPYYFEIGWLRLKRMQLSDVANRFIENLAQSLQSKTSSEAFY